MAVITRTVLVKRKGDVANNTHLHVRWAHLPTEGRGGDYMGCTHQANGGYGCACLPGGTPAQAAAACHAADRGGSVGEEPEWT
jgi:hypothetical protein